MGIDVVNPLQLELQNNSQGILKQVKTLKKQLDKLAAKMTDGDDDDSNKGAPSKTTPAKEGSQSTSKSSRRRREKQREARHARKRNRKTRKSRSSGSGSSGTPPAADGADETNADAASAAAAAKARGGDGGFGAQITHAVDEMMEKGTKATPQLIAAATALSRPGALRSIAATKLGYTVVNVPGVQLRCLIEALLASTTGKKPDAKAVQGIVDEYLIPAYKFLSIT